MIPAACLVGMLVLPGAAGTFEGLTASLLVSYPFVFVAVAFGGGPLGEEIGWRGFALPRLQLRYGALLATLLLGVLWACWHLPEFLTPSQGGGPGVGLAAFYQQFPIFLLMVIALSIIFTWVFNNTLGSLFLVILLHTSFDTFGSTVQPLFSASIVTSTNLPFLIGMGLLAVPILALTRGRLGYAGAHPERHLERPPVA